jgi:transcriptional regulator with XRE-family HTH domain
VRIAAVSFPERLTKLRKGKNLSQGELAKAIDIHVNQVKRYEKGTSQPTLGVLQKLAQVLEVSADELLFDAGARDPDEELRLQFEVISTKFAPEEKQLAKALLDSLILRHEAKRWGT